MTVDKSMICTGISDTLKHELTERLYSHVHDEVRDVLNTEFLDGDLTGLEYDQAEFDILQYLDSNLCIYIK